MRRHSPAERGSNAMPSKIILVRHGPSAHVHSGGLADRNAVRRWRDAYDSIGIKPGHPPPAELVGIASQATSIIASDLARAIASAEALAPQRPIRVSELLREAPLAVPGWPTPLPFRIWEMMIHVGWGYRIAVGADASDADRARAKAAATWLSETVTPDSTALVVTHGVFRRLLAKELVAQGWAGGARRGGYRPWSFWFFSAEPRRLA